MRYAFAASSPADVVALADLVRLLPDAQTPAFASVVMAEGLMRAPWPMRFAVRLIAVRHQVSIANAWGRIFYQGEGGLALARDIRDQTALHAVDGNDTEDADSVGGFSQREIQQLSSLLYVLEGA